MEVFCKLVVYSTFLIFLLQAFTEEEHIFLFKLEKYLKAKLMEI